MSDYSEHLISMAGGDGDVLADIQRRADAATAGPWMWGEETSEWGDCGPNLETVERGPAYSDGSQGAKELVIGSWGHDANGISVEDTDAEFIAHARTDVPRLLALVREQAATIARTRAEADSFDELASHASYNGTEAEMETWLSAATRIRAALEPTK